ncbi:hypothetical protein Q0Z83_064700 [Actinoplanes sichuanensis]|uniref:Phospholipase A2 n=1 Tax=Actinoplanes sichuanensis TaxID=512349 RepID=A0ABW4ALW0_9ACTN|nr:phospholipase A2 [Actinoplanes sichuanensis]BEL08279.1 hypothetical protein Q0Z83_064700 [Actinoplanes sichuanensis]
MKTKFRLLLAGAAAAVLVMSPLGTSAQAAPGDGRVVVVSEVPADGLPPVVVKGPDAPDSYRIAAAVPPGGSLSPARSSDPVASFSGEVVVRNAAGKVVGGYDAPYAVDAEGRVVTGSYRIDGTDLVQSVPADDTIAYPLTVLLPSFNPVSAPRAGVAAAAVTKITVPAGYVYNPSLGSLHDYCTSSPDSYLSADFRGPCARHDMCYEAPGDNKLNCDNTLYQHLGNNCNFAYPTSGPGRSSCLSVAAVYWAAVTAFGDDN